jgi:hypothetical protein
MHLRFRSSGPHSPTLHARINRSSCNAISNEPHGDTKNLDVLVPALIIKEKHLVVFDPTVSVYPCEVCRLVARVYLQMVEVIYRTSRGARCAGYFEQFQHLAPEIWCGSARRSSDKDFFLFTL